MRKAVLFFIICLSFVLPTCERQEPTTVNMGKEVSEKKQGTPEEQTKKPGTQLSEPNQDQQVRPTDKENTKKAERPAVASVHTQPWGPPLRGLHCRLELLKKVFPVSEAITIYFNIGSVDPERLMDVVHMIPVKKKGLIENLVVVGPDGERLPLKASPEHPPVGRFRSRFAISDYYDFSKTGEYQITAYYPLEEDGAAILKSQTVTLLVVPDDLIVITAGAAAKGFAVTGPVPVTITLMTGSDQTVELENVCIRFQMDSKIEMALFRGNIYSYPANSLPSKLTLTKEAKSYEFDIPPTSWESGFSSLHRHRPLSDFVKLGEKQYLVSVLSGKYRGKVFKVKSKPVMLEFVQQDK